MVISKTFGSDCPVPIYPQFDELHAHVWVSGVGKVDISNCSGQRQAKILKSPKLDKT